MLTIADNLRFDFSNLFDGTTQKLVLATITVQQAKTFAVIIRADSYTMTTGQELKIHAYPVWPSGRADVKPGADVLSATAITATALADSETYVYAPTLAYQLGTEIRLVLEAKQATSRTTFIANLSVAAILYDA